MKRLLMILCILLNASPSWAGMCTVIVSRVCHAGKLCRTSESHTDITPSSTECLDYARRFCPVYFAEGVASKQVRVSFDEQPLNKGGNICQ
jgi:hypothetical protein